MGGKTSLEIKLLGYNKYRKLERRGRRKRRERMRWYVDVDQEGEEVGKNSALHGTAIEEIHPVLGEDEKEQS